MKTFLWIYAVVWTLHWVMYAEGVEAVVKATVGPFWLMMMVAPVILGALITLPVARRLGLFDK